MKLPLLLSFGLLVSLAMASPLRADETKAAVSKERPQAAPAVQATFELLMDCIENDTYAAFLVAIDDGFKVALTEKVFKSVVEQVAPRQKKGFQSVYLEELNQQGYKVHLWKLTFADGGDDMLVRLSIKEGKVSGLFLQ